MCKKDLIIHGIQYHFVSCLGKRADLFSLFYFNWVLCVCVVCLKKWNKECRLDWKEILTLKTSMLFFSTSLICYDIYVAVL